VSVEPVCNLGCRGGMPGVPGAAGHAPRAQREWVAAPASTPVAGPYGSSPASC